MRIQSRSSGRFPERLVVFTGIALALIVYAVGAWDSPLLDNDRKAQFDVLTLYAHTGKRPEEKERALAEIYWNRNADVAVDPFFGREGSLGIWGAREHFSRHGKREGRRWPKDAERQPNAAPGQR